MWPTSSHNNQAEHRAPCHHVGYQHELAAACSDPLQTVVVAAASVEPAVVALASFVAELGHRIAVASAAVDHIAAAAADNQHCTAVEAVLARSLPVDRTWFVGLIVKLAFSSFGFYFWTLDQHVGRPE